MRILGLDLGSKTLGVSVSDALGMIARPVETIHEFLMLNHTDTEVQE